LTTRYWVSETTTQTRTTSLIALLSSSPSGKLVAKKFDLRSRRDYDVLMDSFHGLQITAPPNLNIKNNNNNNNSNDTPIDLNSVEVKVETGTEVFFSIYRAAGLSWLVSPLGWKVCIGINKRRSTDHDNEPLFLFTVQLTRPITKWMYGIWAKYRLWLAGRNKEEEWAKRYQCDENSCRHIKSS